MLPASVQEKDGNIIGVRSFPQVVLQGIDLIDEEESMSIATAASKSQTDYEDYKSGRDGLFERKQSINSTTKEEGLSLVFDEYMRSHKTKETGILLFKCHTCHYSLLKHVLASNLVFICFCHLI